MIPPPPTSTLFPYTTLFRSLVYCDNLEAAVKEAPAEARAEPIDAPGELDAGSDKLGHGCGGIYRISDRKSTRLNSSHSSISYAVFCLKKKNAEADAHLQ